MNTNLTEGNPAADPPGVIDLSEKENTESNNIAFYITLADRFFTEGNIKKAISVLKSVWIKLKA